MSHKKWKGHAGAEASRDQNNYASCVIHLLMYIQLFNNRYNVLQISLWCVCSLLRIQLWMDIMEVWLFQETFYPLPQDKQSETKPFCYLFVLLCFVFTSGHVAPEGRQEIVSPIGSLRLDIKGKSPNQFQSKDHWVISFFTMCRAVIKIVPYQIINPSWKTHCL